MWEAPRPPSRPDARAGYLAQDTIAAISTATGGAIAIVRVSGPGAPAVTRALAGEAAASEPRRATRVRLRDASGAALDDAMLIRFQAPASYTGEELVELHVHGGSVTARRVLESALAAGARQALPGEFSFRAVRNGKMTVSQAQAVADLIAASNPDAAGLALEKMDGTQGRLVAGLAEELRTIAMLAEAGIDFSDQDIDEVSLPRLRERLRGTEETLERLRASYGRGQLLQDGFRVAFLGLPNAGKSSFFNALLGEERSIVSESPGTTRDVVSERLVLRGERGSVTLLAADTAGLRVATDPVERLGVERSRQAARDADLAIFLADSSAPAEPALALWHEVRGWADGHCLAFLTKSDLSVQRGWAAVDWPRTSALTGKGIAEAAERIVASCQDRIRRQPQEVLLTRVDQLHAVESALGHLRRGLGAPEPALLAADLRQALGALAPLIGETSADDLLARIFCDFCIGK